MNVDKLVNDLSAPIYTLRMASAMESATRRHSPDHPQARSARTRAANARKRIEQIVREAVESS